MEKKMGVYICTGCGLGDALDIDALAGVATGEYKAPVCRQHAFLCSAEGVDQIKADIEGEGVNALVIAACSPRVMRTLWHRARSWKTRAARPASSLLRMRRCVATSASWWLGVTSVAPA